MEESKKEIRVIAPEGYEIDNFDEINNILTFKKVKDITERIKTLDDVINFYKLNNSSDEDFMDYTRLKHLVYKEHHLVNYQLAILITKLFNEGWVPDWNNSNQPKYYIRFEMSSSSGFRFHVCGVWLSLSAVGSRLAFKNSKLAEYAAKQFTEIYKQFMQ